MARPYLVTTQPIDQAQIYCAHDFIDSKIFDLMLARFAPVLDGSDERWSILEV
jgi:hypothetical protein